MAALGLSTCTLKLSKFDERSYCAPSHLALLMLTLHLEVCFHGLLFLLLVGHIVRFLCIPSNFLLTLDIVDNTLKTLDSVIFL